MNDEFYIGWEAKVKPGIRRVMRRCVLFLVLLALGSAAVLAVSQRLIGRSAFEWGQAKTFTGLLKTRPYPRLLVRRPAGSDGQPEFSTYYLVAPWKLGLNPGAIAALNGKPVSLKGSLIYRDNQTMIETRPEWIQEVGGLPAGPGPRSIALGRRTFIGEIVDSKCFLGVMNPGQLAPHRACAIRCISGGIPPVLLVRNHPGPPTYLLLVSPTGGPVNRQVLDLVAEPVEITGEVERHGELLMLLADPATYRRTK